MTTITPNQENNSFQALKQGAHYACLGTTYAYLSEAMTSGTHFPIETHKTAMITGLVIGIITSQLFQAGLSTVRGQNNQRLCLAGAYAITTTMACSFSEEPSEVSKTAASLIAASLLFKAFASVSERTLPPSSYLNKAINFLNPLRWANDSKAPDTKKTDPEPETLNLEFDRIEGEDESSTQLKLRATGELLTCIDDAGSNIYQSESGKQYHLLDEVLAEMPETAPERKASGDTGLRNRAQNTDSHVAVSDERAETA